MQTADTHYQKISQLSRQVGILESISSLLGWDQETYMPKGAAAHRAAQRELLQGLIHQKRTSPSFAKALSRLIHLETSAYTVNNLSERQKAALKEWRHTYLQEKALPKRFVEKFAKLTSHATEAWKQAKEENNFSKFAPFLEKIVVMNRKKADLLKYKEHPYDALLGL